MFFKLLPFPPPYPDRVSRTTSVLILALALLLEACGGGDAADTTPSTDGPTTTSTSLSPAASTTPTTSGPSTTTTSLPAEDPADLLVVGDWGSGTLPQGAVAGAMQRYADAHEVTAILTTGDNFYSDDWEFLLEPYGWAAESSIPFWIVWGNHDVESQNRIDAVNEAFDDPPRWSLFEWGQVDVVVLDSNQITSADQAVFFLNVMEASVRPTIVVVHHPPYSCSHRGSTTELVNQVVSLLDDDVVLVLSGHDHSYQRFLLDGVNYVVTGGGGSSLNPLSECPTNHPELLAGAELHHFVTLEQTSEGIELTAIDVNGEGFDMVSVAFP